MKLKSIRAFQGKNKVDVSTNLKGGLLLNLTAKELMQLDDYLTLEKSCEKSLQFYAGQTQDQQTKAMLEQMTQKSQANFQRMANYVGSKNKQ